MRIMLFTPPLFLIGDVKEWPPSEDEGFLLSNSAALTTGVMNTPQGPQQVIQFNWLGDMSFRAGGWAAWRKPEDTEERAYQSFRAARSGIQMADPGHKLRRLS